MRQPQSMVVLPREARMGHDSGVSNEFRPGHPVLFWGFMIVFIFAMYEGIVAGTTAHDCKHSGSDEQHFVVFPPKWICSSGHIRLTE